MTFPIYFSAEVWGTVSDWVMILVTALTAVLLYITLKLQAKNSKEQSELFVIEQKRFLKQIMPKPNFVMHYEPNEDTYAILMTIKENDIYHLSIKYSNIGKMRLKSIPEGKSLDAEKLSVGMVTPLELIIDELTVEDIATGKHGIEFNLLFENEIGVKYSQRILSIFGKQDILHLPAVKL